MAAALELFRRLDAIAGSWSTTEGSRALLACGSVGVETARADEYSDLDFFAVVEPDFQARWVADLSWLETVSPIAYRFASYSDAWKVLFSDGLYADFGVVTEDQLKTIPYADARIVWAADGFDTALRLSRIKPPPASASIDWLAGQALNFLYSGLGRYLRGERLSAWNDIQVEAFGYCLCLRDRHNSSPGVSSDPFSPARRFEARHPGETERLESFLRGYSGSPRAALSMLEYLEDQALADVVIGEAIRSRALLALSPLPALHQQETEDGRRW